MKKYRKTILISIFIYILIQAIYTGYHFKIAADLTQVQYVQDLKVGKGKVLKVFMSGDSIAAGVGASSFGTSTSGRLVNYLSDNYYVDFVNEADSGTRMVDLIKKRLSGEKQDLIVLVVSSNDVFHFTDLEKFEEAAKRVLDKYSRLTDKLVLVGPGKVSTAPVLPLPVRYLYKIRESKYADVLEKEARQYSNVIYIKPTDPPKGTFAADKFHPNDEGHKVWFEAIKSAI